jgi:hypothetical protein
MNAALTPDQQATLAACAARGEAASLGDAARQLIDGRIAERAALDAADLGWAKPLVDAALEDVAQGRILTREEPEARMDARLVHPTA